MIVINLNKKALSVNKVWQGRRYKTKEYKAYEKEMLLLLPDLEVGNLHDIKISITFGYSNSLTDIDNGLKPLIDILQKKYNFNDRYVYELNVKKEIVKKGKEFILIKIS